MNYERCGIKNCEFYRTGTCIVGIPQNRNECIYERNRIIHELKILPRYFKAVKKGIKPFEVRKDDREPKYKLGDILKLNEWTPEAGFTGDLIEKEILYIFGRCEDEKMYVPEGYVILGIDPYFNYKHTS